MGAEDHPRVCGENRLLYALISCVLGSPPRVRGKLDNARLFRAVRRITPACAGKTETDRDKLKAEEDHPRVCGENAPSTSTGCATRGSPPRVRGKLRVDLGGNEDMRITPACAGKTAELPD